MRKHKRGTQERGHEENANTTRIARKGTREENPRETRRGDTGKGTRGKHEADTDKPRKNTEGRLERGRGKNTGKRIGKHAQRSPHRTRKSTGIGKSFSNQAPSYSL